MRVTTNHNWRQFVYRCDVPADILQSQFDWLDQDDLDHFLCYKGTWYHLSEFEHRPIDGWDGVKHDSWSCGVLIKLSRDLETYQKG